MQKVAVLLVLFVAIASADVFQDWAQKWNKAYVNDPVVYAQRQAIFNQNVAAMRRKSLALQKKGVAPWFGVNQYTDLTAEEFAQSGRLMKNKLAAVDAISCLANGVTADYSNLNISAVPDSWDWRTKGVVSPVQDQGQCGSCWTFSTIASVESAYAIKTGKLQKLSEQELVDCSKACVKEEGQQVCNQGCDGGWMWSAMTDLIAWKGEMLEADYKYTAEDGTCKRKPASTIDPITNYTCLSGPKKANETEMAAFLVANGPLSIAMDAGILQSYTSGIIKPAAGDCTTTSLDHAILIVGFGVQGTEPFWIIRNSWGASWGEQGYFRIIRGKGACGLNAGVVFPIV